MQVFWKWVPTLGIMLGCFGHAFSQKNNRALIVAIGDYPRDSERLLVWEDLESANDAELLTPSLIKRGFLAQNIITIRDEDATKSGVAKAFELLISQAQKGDIVHIHFSAHGQQITDLNGDENDGYDESIVCYDSPASYYEGYTGDAHFIDDEMEEYIRRLREKLGTEGHLVATFDSCHSGTMTRGENAIDLVKRGADSPLVLPDALKSTVMAKKTDKDHAGWLDGITNNTGYASFVAFSGCQPHEVNYEVKNEYSKGYGSLTFAFCEALTQADATSMNYQDLYLSVKRLMRKQLGKINPSIVQTPCFDGNLQTRIYSGTLIPLDPSFELREIKKDEIEVAAGLLEGLNLNDTLSVRTIDGKKELFRANIIQIGANSCMLKRPKQIEFGNNLSAYDAVLSSTSFERTPLRVAVVGKKKYIKSLTRYFNESNLLLSSDTTAADVIARISNDGRVTLTGVDDKRQVVRQINKLSIDSAAFIVKELEKLKMLHDFASIEIQELQHVKVSFQRAEMNDIPSPIGTEDGFVHPLDSWEKGIVGSFKKDNLLKIDIQNDNTFPIYALVVSLMNDYFFDNESEWNSISISAGDSISFVYETTVNDLSYKIILSKVPFDLSNNPVISAGKARNGLTSEVENLLFPQRSLSRGPDELQYWIQNLFVEIHP